MRVLRLSLMLSVLALIGNAACARAEETPAAKPGNAEVVSAPDPAPKGDVSPKKSDDPKPPVTPNAGERPDPTKPSDRMKRALTKNDPRPVEVHAPEPPKVPEMALRGLVKAADKAPTAMLEIGGKTYPPVHESEVITLKLADGRSLTIKVVAISVESVDLEVVELKTKITLR